MKSYRTRPDGRIFLGVVALAALLGGAIALAAEPAQKSKIPEFKFAGNFEGLTAAQQRLITDWVSRVSKLTGKALDPASVYDNAAISPRTTFEAVTHALVHTALTGEAGTPLGSALDLVDSLEAVQGEVPGARGDLQFRMYARLKAGAVDTLDKCQEFTLGENKTYHKGYPLSYRQAGGAPSIQLSVSKDGSRADIDVDYRSTKFPSVLVNGHLSSANSDIRAGDNIDKHNQRWSGLSDWWRNLFGLPVADKKGMQGEEKSGSLPTVPRAGGGKVQQAMQDFLAVWLLEQNPEQALAYISRRAYGCVPPDDPGQPADQGMAPFRILMNLAQANRALGKPDRLPDVVSGVPLHASWLKPVKNHDPALFSLYEVPNELGEASDCAGGLEAAAAKLTKDSKLKYGEFFLAGLRLTTPQAKGANLYLLWNKEAKYWKIVAFRREPVEAPPAALPDLRPAEAAPAKPAVLPGDPVMINAAADFFTAWLLVKNVPQSLEFVSPGIYPCLNLYREEGTPPIDSPEAGIQFLRERMAATAAKFSRAAKLEDILQTVDPIQSEIGVVAHPHMQAFAIFSVPDHIGQKLACDRAPKRGQRTPEPPGGPKYGNYYATCFQFRVEGGQPATLLLLWAREGGLWKITWLYIDVP
jgi:hypothetical protein